ncbi:MAG: N-acetylmuramic acid 6-phosphate etherase, partial [Gemmatimonadaceae bacterium]
DLKASNVKLKFRALTMVMNICGVTEAEATALLTAANMRVKTAIVMHALGVSAADADAQIEQAGGVVRRIITDAPPPVP